MHGLRCSRRSKEKDYSEISFWEYSNTEKRFKHKVLHRLFFFWQKFSPRNSSRGFQLFEIATEAFFKHFDSVWKFLQKILISHFGAQRWTVWQICPEAQYISAQVCTNNDRFTNMGNRCPIKGKFTIIFICASFITCYRCPDGFNWRFKIGAWSLLKKE